MINNNNFAVVFPGQGSQHVSMLCELAEGHKEVLDVFNMASETLGYDLWDLTQNGPEEKLNKTEYTQPALLAASYAIWQVFIKHTDTNIGEFRVSFAHYW